MATREEIREEIWKLLDDYKEDKGNSAVDWAFILLHRLAKRGVVIKVERELSLISRERAESAIPDTDCSGRKFTPSEWEDLVRTIVHGAEIQRDKDKYDSGYVAVEPLI